MTKVKNFKVEVTLDDEVFSTVSLTDPDGVPRNLVQYVLRGLVSEWLAKGDFWFAGEAQTSVADDPVAAAIRATHEAEGAVHEFVRRLNPTLPEEGIAAKVPDLVSQVLAEKPEFELAVESSGGKLVGLVTRAQLARRLNFDGDASLIPSSGVEDVSGLGRISWSKAPLSALSKFLAQDPKLLSTASAWVGAQSR